MNEMKAIKSGIVGVAAVAVLTVGGFVFFEKIDNGNVGIEYSKGLPAHGRVG
ncbi:hypothetical protein GKC32_10830 (plasmid) [Lactobacillus curvatus]|nr:hypothetical protein [Latilactobacillus curvatus]MSD84732.1 hypothetical protein [Latilactobacillus curvatus]MSE23468.1 hypothetical protein [Latilactobacillus curvatus]MSE24932.1 hypothetical protein [Latilactobacillus curvatus]